MSEGRGRILWGGLGALGLAGLVAAFYPKLLVLADSPETTLILALKKTEAAGLELGVPGAQAPLLSDHHRFDRLAVSLDLPAGRATVTATLDFTGRFSDTEVSALTFESIPFTLSGGRWSPVVGLAPRLSAAMGALERRRRALETRDEAELAALRFSSDAGVGFEPAVLAHWRIQDLAVHVKAWYLRGERDEMVVREEYRLQGKLPDRPVDDEGARRLELVLRSGQFFFSNGFM